MDRVVGERCCSFDCDAADRPENRGRMQRTTRGKPSLVTSSRSASTAAIRVCLGQVGLEVLRRKGTVLRCYNNMAETVTFSEIGMSVAVLEAGYNIDSLMLRYQVHPFHHPSTDTLAPLRPGLLSPFMTAPTSA